MTARFLPVNARLIPAACPDGVEAGGEWLVDGSVNWRTRVVVVGHGGVYDDRDKMPGGPRYDGAGHMHFNLPFDGPPAVLARATTADITSGGRRVGTLRCDDRGALRYRNDLPGRVFPFLLLIDEGPVCDAGPS